MAIRITEDCINCGACEPECPNNAIYEEDQPWKFSDGTGLVGKITLPDGSVTDADTENTGGGFSEDIYFIATDKCTECKDFMMSHNVQLYVLLIVVFQMKKMSKLKKNC